MTTAYSLSQAEQLEREAKLEDAVLAYSGILARNPKNSRANQALRALRGRLSEQREPSADMRQEMEATLAAGQHFEAAESCGALLKTFRESHFLWDFLGRCHLAAGHLDNAATCLNKASGLNNRDAGTHTAMGQVQMARGDTEAAMSLYRRALALDANCLPALRSLSAALDSQGHSQEAAATLRQAIALAPQDAPLQFALANVLNGLGASAEARALYITATELDPSLTAAQFQLGLMLLSEGKPAEALPCFDTILRADPSDDPARTQRLTALAMLGDWRWVDEYAQYRRQLGLRGSGCDASALMHFEDNPDLLRVRAQAFASTLLPLVEPHVPSPLPIDSAQAQRPAQLRIGYVFDARDAAAVLDRHGAMFAAHDRSRFAVHLLISGGTPDIETTQRLRRTRAQLHMTEAGSDEQLVSAARAAELHIAVDLGSRETTLRAAHFATRLAPLHVLWSGQPATTGSAAYDYLVSDTTACPPGSERYHNEYLMRLAGSFLSAGLPASEMASDAALDHPDRASCGLPETGFVFCCFAPVGQISPQEFDIWMRLLATTADSCLWLLDSNDHACSNLRRQAARRGIDPDRLIFAAAETAAAQRALLPLADLFLDTFTVNAGDVARNALVAGVPVLTVPGRQLVARTSASLLVGAGLPELIAQDEAAYETMAAALASDPDASTALRQKLAAQQQNAPLFDPTHLCRQAEAAFDAAYERQLQGRTPDHLGDS